MKTYYTHLEEAKAKLELSKLEKVELGLIDDLEKDYKKTASAAIAPKKAATKAGNDLIDVSIELKDIAKRADIIVKKAKELGAKNVVAKMNTIADAAKSLSKEWLQSGSKILTAAKEV